MHLSHQTTSLFPVTRSMKRFSFLFVCLLPLLAKAQDMPRVRATIDLLCAPAMHGRGYVKQGERLAANYLAQQFTQIGLQSFGTSYFQPFTLSINTFPKKIVLKLDDRTLVPGKDYLLSEISKSGKGKASLMRLDTTIFTDESARQRFLQMPLSQSVVVYRKKEYSKLVDLPLEYLNKLHEAQALIELQDNNKLTASVSTAQVSKPIFEIKTSDFKPETKTVKFKAYAKLIPDYPTQNVVGYVKGTAEPDSFLVLSAHYDHLGMMGPKTYFPGANDNASGVSMLLELAHYFKAHPPRYSVAFLAFSSEEAGLIGSKFYVEHPLFPLKQIRFLMNLDLLGTGDDGIMVQNAPAMAREFDLMTQINERNHYFPALSKRTNAPNSDHFFFTNKGVRGVFFYTLGGIKAYHDVDDRAATLPLTKYREVFGLLRDTVEALAK